MSHTEKLIQALANDLTPIRPLPLPRRRLLAWSMAAIAVIAMLLAAHGVRPDIADKMQAPLFWVQTGIALLLILLGGLTAFKLAVPQAGRRWEYISAALSGVWLGWLLLFVATASASQLLAEMQQFSHEACFGLVMLCGIASGSILFYQLRRSFSLAPRQAGLAAALSATGTGFLASLYFCPNENPAHIALAHLLPVTLAGLIGVALGHWIVRRR